MAFKQTVLTSTQIQILDQLPQYVPALKQGQISKANGGDIALGTIISEMAPAPKNISPLGVLTPASNQSTTNTNIAALQAQMDNILAVLNGSYPTAFVPPVSPEFE